jgi:hypothetical protein
MIEMQNLLPALGADGQHAHHAIWPLLLALVVFTAVLPIAYFFGHGGGRADETHHRTDRKTPLNP